MGSFFSKTPPPIRYNDYINIRFQQQTDYRKIGPPGGLKCPLKEEYRSMPGLESTFDSVEDCESGKLKLMEKIEEEREQSNLPVKRREFDPHHEDYAENERNRQLAYEQAEQISNERKSGKSGYRGGKKSRRSKSQKKRRSYRKSTKKARKTI